MPCLHTLVEDSAHEMKGKETWRSDGCFLGVSKIKGKHSMSDRIACTHRNQQHSELLEAVTQAGGCAWAQCSPSASP